MCSKQRSWQLTNQQGTWPSLSVGNRHAVTSLSVICFNASDTGCNDLTWWHTLAPRHQTLMTLNLTSNDIGTRAHRRFSGRRHWSSSQDVPNAKIYLSFIYFSLHNNGILNWIMVVGLSLSDDRHFFFSVKCCALPRWLDFLTSMKISCLSACRKQGWGYPLTLIGLLTAICRTSASKDSPELS